jgi:hypothetical protein
MREAHTHTHTYLGIGGLPFVSLATQCPLAKAILSTETGIKSIKDDQYILLKKCQPEVILVLNNVP